MSVSRVVLIVDDNADNLKLLTRFLTAKGFNVVGASNTEEADAAIAKEPPAVVLVDVSLPGEDGLSWVTRIRSQFKAAQFVALTAHIGEAARDRARSAGCDHFITKPVHLRDLQTFLSQRLMDATS